MVEFYEELTCEEKWVGLRPILEFVRRCADGEAADRFRAGQSLNALVISTAPQWGLGDGDPYVVVCPTPNGAHIRVRYFDGRSQRALANETLEPGNFAETVERLMRRLAEDSE